MKYKYGWKQDTEDHRDQYYNVALDVLQALPKSVDLRSGCSPVEDQKQLGSCTANALVGNLEFLEIKQGSPYVDLSRLFVYYQERAMEGTIDEDSGARIRDGVKSLVKFGTCPERMMPYVPEAFTVAPTPDNLAAALEHRVTSYKRVVGTLGQMRGCLAEGYPFVFGFTVYESFESATVARTGIMPIPDVTRERMLGGHAIMAVGYDDATKRLLIRNSWGKPWGMQGYFTMPYECALSGADFWTLRKEG